MARQKNKDRLLLGMREEEDTGTCVLLTLLQSTVHCHNTVTRLLNYSSHNIQFSTHPASVQPIRDEGASQSQS